MTTMNMHGKISQSLKPNTAEMLLNVKDKEDIPGYTEFIFSVK